MKDFDASSISLLSYLKIFFRRKELLIIPIFIGLILGICTGIILPRKYRSETVIMVQEGKSDNPLFDKLAVSTTISQRMTGLRESILGWNSLTELVKRLKLDKDVKNKAEFEELIRKVKNGIKLKLRGNNIINLAYVSDDPEMTQAVVATITEIFIDQNIRVQNDETADAITFIEQQLKVYKGKIKSAEIAKLQEQLDTLLADSTEKHPLVRRLQDQIAVKKEALRAENLEYFQDINLEKDTTNPTTAAGGRIDNNAQLTLNLDLQKVLARDAGVNEDIYNMLLQRLETAKITQRLQSSKEGTQYTILDPPRIPLKPFQPNIPFVALIGLFLGAVAGVGLVIGAEFLDKSFIDVEDAKNLLGVPLLGAISKISTTDSIRLEHEKERWLYSTTVAIGVIVVIVTAAVSNFIK